MDQNQQQPQDDQPMMAGGNDELAKTLSNGGMQFEETPMNNGGDSSAPAQNDQPADGPMDNNYTSSDTGSDTTPPSMDAMPPVDDQQNSGTTDGDAPASSDLETLKTNALDDLRPLVGKLNLTPEERFDTLLLIIRSTDDQSLLSQAHAAAKEITDESKRAQALLDIIKEVDYFNSKK